MKFAFNGVFAAGDIAKKLDQFLPKTPGFFVEIGGNDGISQSNTKGLELYHGWRGLLVEPALENYNRMLRTRAAETHLFRGACVPFDFEGDSLKLVYSDLMTIPLGLVSDLSDSAAHVESGSKWIRSGKGGEVFEAKALRLNDLLLSVDAPKEISFFSLDVEGAEMSVLKGVDHDTFRFRYLLVECRDLETMSDYLQSIDYELVTQVSHHDYLFKCSRVGAKS